MIKGRGLRDWVELIVIPVSRFAIQCCLLKGIIVLGSILMILEGSPINSPGSSPRLVDEMTRGKEVETAIEPVGVECRMTPFTASSTQCY